MASKVTIRLTLASVVLLGSTLMGGAKVSANFSGATGTTGCGATDVNTQDNITMTFYRNALTADMFNAVANTINVQINTGTDIVVSPEQSAEDANTDVVYFDSDYSTLCTFDWHPDDPADSGTSAVIGFYECRSLSGQSCQKAYVRFDTSYVASVPAATRTQAARALSCHESGHSLGLQHRDNGTAPDIGCMPASIPANFPSNYTGHDVAHVNSYYN